MKQVWKFYNQRFKPKTQNWIPIKDQAQMKEFMQFWRQLYSDESGKNILQLEKDNVQHNY